MKKATMSTFICFLFLGFALASNLDDYKQKKLNNESIDKVIKKESIEYESLILNKPVKVQKSYNFNLSKNKIDNNDDLKENFEFERIGKTKISKKKVVINLRKVL